MYKSGFATMFGKGIFLVLVKGVLFIGINVMVCVLGLGAPVLSDT